jgi:hypothetical protein
VSEEEAIVVMELAVIKEVTKKPDLVALEDHQLRRPLGDLSSLSIRNRVEMLAFRSQRLP